MTEGARLGTSRQSGNPAIAAAPAAPAPAPPAARSRSAVRAAAVALSLAALTAAHYLTPHHAISVHDLLFKVTFLPLIVAGLWFRPRTALAFSAATSAAYLVHVFLDLAHAGHGSLWVGDVVLYNVVALVTSILSQRRADALARMQAQARQLEENTRALLTAEETIRRTERLRSVGELASGMAHEIRNPLSGVRGAAEVLAKEDTAPAARREFAHLLEEEVARLDKVVRNFLDFARPPRAEAASVPVKDVVSAVLLLVVGEARSRDVLLDDLSPPALAARADADLLRQVLLNVVLNALQAQPRGGRVRVTASSADGSVRIDVEDAGPGVPDALRRTLFDPYVSGREGGTGLGLAVASRLMETMQGSIALAATGPQGSTFRLTLPAA
jgi:signal transduction histidine kinase